MLDYTWRVRDLVHGTIQFTQDERIIIEQPLFERLRNVKQNDLTSTIYPSVNTSRFEHVLGVCHIAGKMAETLTRSRDWNVYEEWLCSRYPQFANDAKVRFVTVTRLYALLHDIGHFPLSHLFEEGFRLYAESIGKSRKKLAGEWFEVEGYEKPHEAFGAYIAPRLMHHVPQHIAGPLTRLMVEKEIEQRDPLYVLKRIVDGEIDADRIDFVQRDGLMAGGEYGNYDINRLCSSVQLAAFGRHFDIAFSDKSTTSLEALLLDRYRVYLWVHFHHRAVTVKALAARLIARALEEGLIKREHFTAKRDRHIAGHDDAWLLCILRGMSLGNDRTLGMMRDAVFFHNRANVFPLWKRRAAYHRLNTEVANRIKTELGIESPNLLIPPEQHETFEQHLAQRLGMTVLYQPIDFSPLSGDRIYLYSGRRPGDLRSESLQELSPLTQSLPSIWESGDPQSFVILIRRDIGKRLESDEKALEEMRRKWVEATIEYHLARPRTDLIQ